jgi:hypothetical protein
MYLVRGEPISNDADADAISRLFDSPISEKQILASEIPSSELLPSRKTATELVNLVFRRTYPLLQFLHESAFRQSMGRLYDLDPMDFEEADHDFLPLFHSVTALGYLFDQDAHKKYGCKGTVNHAYVEILSLLFALLILAECAISLPQDEWSTSNAAGISPACRHCCA